MSGFLQHIAMSAARRERTVHPFVGSIYENVTTDQAAEAPPAMERFILTDHAEQRVGGPAGPMPRADSAATARPRSVELLVPHATAPAPMPFLPERAANDAERDAGNPLRVPPIAAREPSGEQGQALRATSAQREETAGDAARMAMPSETGPLVLQPLRVGEPPAKQGSDAELAPAQGRPREQQRAIMPRAGRPPIPRRATSPPAAERDTRDIEIHIGRIEVIAVPPPPAARPAKPVRQSSSLEQYLKRRDGRAS